MSTNTHRTASAHFGAALANQRDRRGFTQQQLADRLADLYDPDPPPLTRNAIAKIEAGRRGVSLDNWLALAAALDVPPLLLIAPLDADRLEVTPRHRIHPDLAMRWLTGMDPLSTTQHKTTNASHWARLAEPLRAFERLRDTQARMRDIQQELDRGTFAGFTDDAITEIRLRYADVLGELRERLTELAAADLAAPRLDKRTRNDMRELGLSTGKADR